MNNLPSSAQSSVPAIRIHNAEYSPALFDGGEIFNSDMTNLYSFFAEDTTLYACSQGMQSEALAFNPSSSPSAELEDIPELSHLTTMNQPFLTSLGYSQPYASIIQDHSTSADGGLSPSSLSSPVPSPTSSFCSSLSPSSLYDSFALSDTESSLSPDASEFPWPAHLSNHQSSDSLTLHPSSIGSYPPPAPQRPRSRSSPSFRPGPMASKAMLEANGRRRRHPAQFECEECSQTFTALFSLKRHQQSHSGERPFACSIPGCSQRFFNSSDCKRHEKSRKRHKDL